MADRVGHRVVSVGGLAIFALASFVCGLAPNPTVLIVTRVVQGIGGAAKFALLNSSYTGRDRGNAYGMWGAVSGASAATGPLVGGPLNQGLSWRWIFFINVPVSVIAIATCFIALRDAPIRRTHRIDEVGIAVSSVAVVSMTFGMIRANEDGWAAPSSWGSLTVGAGLLLAFAVLETRSPQPLLDEALLRNRVFGGVLIAAGLLNLAVYVSFVYTSIWMQSILHLSPVTAGLVTLPMSVAAFVVSAALGPHMTRLRPDWVIGGRADGTDGHPT